MITSRSTAPLAEGDLATDRVTRLIHLTRRFPIPKSPATFWKIYIPQSIHRDSQDSSLPPDPPPGESSQPLRPRATSCRHPASTTTTTVLGSTRSRRTRAPVMLVEMGPNEVGGDRGLRMKEPKKTRLMKVSKKTIAMMRMVTALRMRPAEG